MWDNGVPVAIRGVECSGFSSQREKKIFCGDTHYLRLTRLTEVTAHFRPENRPLQDALYQYIIFINLFIKKNIIDPKFVNPWLWILSVPQFCQPLSTFVNTPYYNQLVDIHILVCCQHYQPPNVCYL